MRYLLGLDVGTSAVKAVLLETGGRLVGSVLEEYPLSTPRPGWSEQNPEDMWQATIKRRKDVANSTSPSAIVVFIGSDAQLDLPGPKQAGDSPRYSLE